MDYQCKEERILEFIQDNFNAYLPGEGLKPIVHFLNEWLDLDRFNYDATLWTYFNAYAYQDLSNESRLETGNLTIYIVVRNSAESTLHKRLRDYASAFFTMFERTGCNFGGCADYGIIESVNFYDAAEGNPALKVVEINVTFYKEE